MQSAGMEGKMRDNGRKRSCGDGTRTAVGGYTSVGTFL